LKNVLVSREKSNTKTGVLYQCAVTEATPSKRTDT